MVRCGGLGYAIDVSKPIGQRISAMTLLKTGKPIEPKKEYTVAGWASVNEGTQGPPVWELVERYVAAEKTVRDCAQQQRENFRGLAAISCYIHKIECDKSGPGRHPPGAADDRADRQDEGLAPPVSRGRGGSRSRGRRRTRARR